MISRVLLAVSVFAPALPGADLNSTLFERLESKGLTWRVYCDPPSPASFTGIIHASRLHKRFATNFLTVPDFLEDVRTGHLPTYSFIEPNVWYGHNDMHPPEAAVMGGCDSTHRLLCSAVRRCSRRSTTRSGPHHRRADPTPGTRCCRSPSTSTAAPTTMYRRRPRRPRIARRNPAS